MRKFSTRSSLLAEILHRQEKKRIGFPSLNLRFAYMPAAGFSFSLLDGWFQQKYIVCSTIFSIAVSCSRIQSHRLSLIIQSTYSALRPATDPPLRAPSKSVPKQDSTNQLRTSWKILDILGKSPFGCPKCFWLRWRWSLQQHYRRRGCYAGRLRRDQQFTHENTSRLATATDFRAFLWRATDWHTVPKL